MKQRSMKFTACLLAFLCLGGFTAEAAKAGAVYAARTGEEEIILYIENPGEYTQAECQIGTQMCESVEFSPVAEEAVPMKTLFLVDNSLSVTEEYRPQAADILTQLAANRMNGELFTVASFSTEIQYLLEDSGDYAQVKTAIDSLTYQDQETYLTDVLYELLSDMKESGDLGLSRIVIVSDGMDNQEIGYTKEELYSLLDEKICPIYTLGCTYNSNSEELENMFALSRMTGGGSWLLDNVTDDMEVVNGIAGLNGAWKVTVTPKTEQCDGTTKGLALTFTGEEETSYTLELQMPFARHAGETVDTAVDAEGEGDTSDVKPAVLEADDSEDALNPVIQTSGSNFSLPLFIAAAVLLLAAAAVCVILLKKKGKKEEFQKAPDSFITGTRGIQTGSSAKQSDRVQPGPAGSAQAPQGPRPSIQPQTPPKTRKTHLMFGGETGGESKESRERKTLFVWGKKLVLTDQNDPRQEFSAVLNGEVTAGWDADCQICIRYNDTISGKHLAVREMDGKVLARNLSRTNPLAVNGKTAQGEVEIHTGDVLTLGEVNMKVRIEG